MSPVPSPGVAEVDYPAEDGEPMAETPIHVRAIMLCAATGQPVLSRERIEQERNRADQLAAEVARLKAQLEQAQRKQPE